MVQWYYEVGVEFLSKRSNIFFPRDHESRWQLTPRLTTGQYSENNKPWNVQ